LADSMADVRDLYQAKQAAGKTKKMIQDETKNRDQDDTTTSIRSYPLAASTSPPRELKNLSTSSTSVINK
ncbi:unnamed protein product, partial [Rotaria sp. Silwood1]